MGKTYRRNTDGKAKVRKVRKAAQDRKATRRLEEQRPEHDE